MTQFMQVSMKREKIFSTSNPELMKMLKFMKIIMIGVMQDFAIELKEMPQVTLLLNQQMQTVHRM